VGYLILEMREGSGWGDSESHYEFPARYLPRFEEALADGDAVALIYEPRREGGRMAFVAWTRVIERPTRSADGRNWIVRFEGGLRSFDRVVPFQIDGLPVEHRLREFPPERRGVALQGKAVRTLSAQNAMEVLALGSATRSFETVDTDEMHVAEELQRGRRMVERLDRDARFRDEVLLAYDFRCALTGLGLGPRPASRLHGVIDAAHIRPAARNGPDHVRNGIAMTPTVHRLFDAGLFALRARAGAWVVELSSVLEPSLLTAGRGTRIHLVDGLRLETPNDVARQPLAEHLEYHLQCVFVA
jgi:putative restriction endonuclease